MNKKIEVRSQRLKWKTHSMVMRMIKKRFSKIQFEARTNNDKRKTNK